MSETKDCGKCKDFKPMHAKCAECEVEVCATCFEGSSMACPGCGEEKMELLP